MPELQGSRRKLQIAIAAMVVVDLLAVGVLFSPLVGSAASRRVTMSELQIELQKKRREVEPLKGIDKKIVLARKNIVIEAHADRPVVWQCGGLLPDPLRVHRI